MPPGSWLLCETTVMTAKETMRMRPWRMRVTRTLMAAVRGAGADATGGDIRDEGEDAREGGADGARA